MGGVYLHKDVKEILYTKEQITAKCEELGAIISKDYEGKRPVLLGLLIGSVPFMAELCKYLTVDLTFDFMHVSSYVGALKESALLKTFKTAPSKPVIVFSPWFISSPAVMPDLYW